MGDEIVLLFPFEPVPKARPRLSYRGRVVYTPTKTKTFERNIRLYAGQIYKEPKLECPLAVGVYCYLRRPVSVKREYPAVKPDCDNFLKSVLDACNGVVWRDDAQIVDLVFQKRYATGNGSIKLTINKLEETNGDKLVRRRK